MMHKIEYVLKHNAVIQKLYITVMSFLFRMLGLFVKTNKKQVLFQSLIGKNYGDSPKVLFDAMKKDLFFANFKYVWAFENPEDYVVEGASKVKLNSFNYFITALMSGIWITNVNIERGLHFKPKETIYLNTWHGAPIKIGGNAQPTRKDYDYSDVDYMCSFSEFDDEVFIRDFKVRKDALIRCGMPRNDVLFNVDSEVVRGLKEKYKIPNKKKVILYAPTWRDSKDGGDSYTIAPPINISYWRELLEEDYILLFRMHHLSTEQIGLQFDDFIRDYSGNYSINDLMMMADILISDYSGTIFDFLSMEKPIFLFAYDYEEYKKVRGLYIDLNDILPGNVCYDEKSLLNHIVNIDYDAECAKSHNAKKKYMDIEGNATEICMNYIKISAF